MDNKLCCEHCWFWRSIDKRKGTCRKNPPAIIDETKEGEHPITSKDSWCGEFINTAEFKRKQKLAGIGLI